MNHTRPAVIDLYKRLLFAASQIPGNPSHLSKEKVRIAFRKNSHLESHEQIKTALSRGEFVLKEIEALISLHKYRAMKDRYTDDKDF
ncbi:LYR-motif-containing protein [Acrasis kona]|uniref:LYR-motif-containing protein n=1 Tax=Acrasis kona TaxID=1008807 RepID=A0AAW2YI82_9EUKA